MKRQFLVSVLAAMAGAASFAQSPTPWPPNASESPEPFRHWRMLSADEHDALLTAAGKARENPAVRAAAIRLQQAVKGYNQAMIARDASIGPVLEKAELAGGLEGFHIRLTGDESEQLRADREAMKGTAAEDALQRAMADYRKAAVHALIAADPSLAGVADSLPLMGMRGLLAPELAPSPSPSP